MLRLGVGFASLIALGLLADCKCTPESKAVVDAGEAAAEAGAPKVPIRALAIRRHEMFKSALWMKGGGVAAISDNRFWWFRPDDKEPSAKTTVLSGLINGLVVAKGADVAVVSTNDGHAHVFHGGEKVRSILTERGFTAYTLSDDGELLGCTTISGGLHKGRTYDLHTGKPVDSSEGRMVFSDDRAEYVMDWVSIRRTRDGSVVRPIGDRTVTTTLGAGWVDGKAVLWSESGLMIIDPNAPEAAPTRIAAKCERIEISDQIDVIGKRAVRTCARQLIVVRLDEPTPTPIVIPFPVVHREENIPQVFFEREGDAIFVEWGNGQRDSQLAIEEGDLAKKTMHPVPSFPLRRLGNGNTPYMESAPSPNKAFLLTRTNASAVVVKERDGGRERVRWGLSDGSRSFRAQATFLHEGGLEILGQGEAIRHETNEGTATQFRIGPPAKTPLTNLPPLRPQTPPCPEVTYGGEQINNNNTETIFIWGPQGSCVCVAGGCTNPKLPADTLARSGVHLLVDAHEGNAKYLEDRVERGTGYLEHTLRAATFLDERKGAVFLTQNNLDNADRNLIEVALPSFDLKHTWRVAGHRSMLANPNVIGAAGSIVTVQSAPDELEATVVKRTADPAGRIDETGPFTEIDAWFNGAVVTLPDGRVELFGEKAETTVVCLEGNVARPFSTCRAQLEAKGVFRID